MFKCKHSIYGQPSKKQGSSDRAETGNGRADHAPLDLILASVHVVREELELGAGRQQYESVYVIELRRPNGLGKHVSALQCKSVITANVAEADRSRTETPTNPHVHSKRRHTSLGPVHHFVSSSRLFLKDVA